MVVPVLPRGAARLRHAPRNIATHLPERASLAQRPAAGLTLVAILLSGAVNAVLAGTIRVPADQPTIWEGLDAAVVGDTVLVAPGTYTETITRTIGATEYTAAGFLTSGVTLRAETGAAATSLEPQSVYTIVATDFTTDDTARIEGFTFRPPDQSSRREGVYGLISHSQSLEVRGCVFDQFGGPPPYSSNAIRISGLSAVIDCVFDRCVSGSSSYAAGVRSQSHNLCVITGCTFMECHPRALYLDGGSVEITDSIFSRGSGRGSAAIYSWSTVRVARCLFVDNVVSAGTLTVFYSPSAVVEDNVFLRNHGTETGTLAWTSEGLVRRNTFHGNSMAASDRAIVQVGDLLRFEANVVSGSSGGPALADPWRITESCNVYWMNEAGDVSGFPMSASSRVLDPLYCDVASGDLRVADNSPCVPGLSGGCGQIGAEGVGCVGGAPFGVLSLDSEPQGMRVRVGELEFVTPQALPLLLYTTHTVEIDSAVVLGAGTRWRFASWSDGEARGHAVTILPGELSLMATFEKQHQLTTSVDGLGAVEPAAGWFAEDDSLSVLAVPALAYAPLGWTGNGDGSYSGTANPAAVVMREPIHQHATFVRQSMEYSLSLSPADPHVHSGPPLDIGSVYLWVACGTGADFFTLECRASGSINAFNFVPEPGVQLSAADGDLFLTALSCPAPPSLLGTFGVYDPGGGKLCLSPAASTQRLGGTGCSNGEQVSFLWPADVKVHGVSTDGEPWCVGGRGCGEFDQPIAIRLSGLEAVELNRAVELRWQTSFEQLHDGFRVYRSDGLPDTYVQMHPGLLRGRSPYAWLDREVEADTQYYYELGAVDRAGHEDRYGPVTVRTSSWAPLVFALDGARPNPVGSRTQVQFRLPAERRVRMRLYDVTGRLVATLLDAPYPRGEQRFEWKGRDEKGRVLPAGVYFLRLEDGREAQTRRVVMLRTR